MDNLKTRILSSVILLPVLIFIIYLGGIPFLVATMLILGVGAWEYWRMYSRNEANRNSLCLSIILTIAIICGRYFGGFEIGSRILTVCVFIAMFLGVLSFEKENHQSANGFAVMVTCFVYFGWIGSYLLTLRNLDNGFGWVMICLLLTWVGDAGAFFVGSLFGKHAMSPVVSPHKTWEGYVGGILTAFLFAMIFHRLTPDIRDFLTMKQVLILSLSLSTIGVIGDLGESMIKRTFGFKDSSNLIPGHGGVFDRLDTVLWAMPIGYGIYTMINFGLI